MIPDPPIKVQRTARLHTKQECGWKIRFECGGLITTISFPNCASLETALVLGRKKAITNFKHMASYNKDEDKIVEE